MFRIVLVLAFCGTIAACATPQERTAEVECVDETVERTGTRVPGRAC